MKNRSFHWLIWTGVVIVMIAALLGSFLWMMGVPNGWKLSGLLQDSLNRQSLDADVTLSSSVHDNSFEIQTEFFKRTSDNLSLCGVTLDGIPVCYSNQRIIFDNGKVYDLSSMIPAGVMRTDRVMKLLPFSGVKKSSAGDDTVYSLELDASKLQKVFPDLMDASALTADFTEHDGVLSKMYILFDNGSRKTEMTLRFVPERQRELPAEMWDAISVQNPQSVEVVVPLLKALDGLANSNPLGAELAVSADCGPVAVTDTMMLYRTDRGLYLQREGDVRHLEALDLSNHALLGLGYKFCRDGRFSRVGDSGSYSLHFPSESVKAWCIEMLPEIEVLPITYEDAALVFEVKDNTLFHVKMDVSGQMPFLLTTIDIALGVELRPVPSEQIVLPEGAA